MALTQRQKEILTLVKRDLRVRVDDLAVQFDATPQTIRKDLQVLADQHFVVRFHGGASLLSGTQYDSWDSRRAAAAPEKQAIGAQIAARIPNHSTVFINAGTTTDWVVSALDGHFGLRLITDNVDLAASARRLPGADVIIPCGTVRQSDGAILGAETVEFLRQFKVDVAVIGAAGIDRDGALCDFDMAEAQLCRAIIYGARHVIVAVDASKFERPAPLKFAELSRIDALVTDARAPDWVQDICTSHNVEFLTANMGPTSRIALSA